MSLSHIARLWVLLPILVVGTAAGQAPVGAAFTYQGRLMETALPANGSYDFRFTLYDAPGAGNVIGGPLTLPGVAVSQGLFTVALDFGSGAFQGQARFLEIEVQPSGGGGFILLTPRQELRPSPGSVFSSYTDPANLTILNASNLTSGTVPDARVSGAYSQPLALTNPANAVSGTFTGDGFSLTNLNADNLASGTVPGARLSGTYPNAVTFPDTGNFFTGDGSGLFNLNAQPKYVRTAVVSPVGAPVANGAALLAALAGITTASAANPWLLKVEPGIYDVGATSLVMKPFVDVEGSGEAVTRITGVGNALNTVGTVQVVADSELRFLTVENTGGAAYAKAIYVNAASPRISHVTALASGATTQESQGIFVEGAASPKISNVISRATATGSARSYGMLDVGSSSLQQNVDASTDGGAFSQAVWICCGAAPTLRNVSATATGGTENRGLVIIDASPRLENVVATASGAAANNVGLFSTSPTSSPILQRVTCRASGATSQNTGCGIFGGTQATMDGIIAEGTGGTQAIGIQNSGAGAGHSVSGARAVASGASSLVAGFTVLNCSPRVTHLSASADGSGSAGVYGLLLQSTSSNLSHVTASATAAGATSGTVAGVAVGVATTAPVLTDGVVSASGSSTETFGVWNDNNTAPTLDRVRVSVQGGGGFSLGVLNDTGSQVSLTDVTSTATGPGGTIAGIYNFGAASVQIAEAVATATGAAGNRFGLANAGGSPSSVTVDRSTLTGVTNSVSNGGASGLRIGGSQLVGLVTTGAGSSTSCVLSYNGGYAPVNALCQ